jgi:hypothetical protein
MCKFIVVVEFALGAIPGDGEVSEKDKNAAGRTCEAFEVRRSGLLLVTRLFVDDDRAVLLTIREWMWLMMMTGSPPPNRTCTALLHNHRPPPPTNERSVLLPISLWEELELSTLRIRLHHECSAAGSCTIQDNDFDEFTNKTSNFF